MSTLMVILNRCHGSTGQIMEFGKEFEHLGHGTMMPITCAVLGVLGSLETRDGTNSRGNNYQSRGEQAARCLPWLDPADSGGYSASSHLQTPINTLQLFDAPKQLVPHHTAGLGDCTYHVTRMTALSGRILSGPPLGNERNLTEEHSKRPRLRRHASVFYASACVVSSSRPPR
ncbi:hypothetical protein VTG60DRAFT_3987 [Thermothelomyces hinnuleus]